MSSSNEARIEILDKEIEALVKQEEGTEVSVPTQPVETVDSESSDETIETTVEQTNKQTETLESWKDRALVAERRYNTSKPKYDSNIFKLKQENIALQKDRVNLKKEFNTLRQKKAAENNKLDELFDQKTVDVLGEDTANNIKASIKDTYDRLDLQEKLSNEIKIKAEEDKIASQVSDAYNAFLSRLTTLVPDQASLNVDTGFLNYLKEVDGHSGYLRQDLLTRAANNHDVGRVAQFFLDYKATKKVEPVKDSINKRIAPTESSSTSIGDIADSGKITLAFVDKFYSDVTRGLYKGRHKEQLAIEADIDKAYLEGNLI
jgi:hypothetical protein